MVNDYLPPIVATSTMRSMSTRQVTVTTTTLTTLMVSSPDCLITNLLKVSHIDRNQAEQLHKESLTNPNLGE